VKEVDMARLARILWILALVLVAGAGALMLDNLPAKTDMFYLALLVPAFSTVGMVIATRRSNTVGWLFLGVGLVGAVGALSGKYALRTLQAKPGSLPGGDVVAWVTSWIFLCLLASVFLLLLLFPDGRPPSTRWRPIAWGLLATFAAWILWVMLRPQPIVFEGTKVPNPFAIQAVAHPGIVGAVLAGLNFLTASAAAFASVLAPFVRWRRAGPQERRQLMWLAFVVVAWPVCLLATLASYAFLPAASSIMAVVLLAGAIAGIPVAVGIAILRHRLYDIDRLINRTVVYGLLTALLGAVYAGLVLVLGQLFGAVGDQTPSWAVAGATLAVAALFQPARRRIQAVVDRRFNRRRFNAVKIVEAFSLRLREEVDLDALSAELLAVVDQTMQPAKASLWLRPPIERMRSTGV
jgi:hypothetical protein